MEREKPEHLDRLPRDQSAHTTLWLLGVAVVIGGLAFAGWQLHARTAADWESKFGERRAAPIEPVAAGRWQSKDFADGYVAGRQEAITGLEPIITKYELEIAAWQAGRLRCVGKTVFRRVENGWENVPNVLCTQPGSVRSE